MIDAFVRDHPGLVLLGSLLFTALNTAVWGWFIARDIRELKDKGE